MTKVDKVLRFICRGLGLIFIFCTAFALVGCLFGLILMRHVENPADVYTQVRALAFVAFICFLVSFSFHCTAELIN